MVVADLHVHTTNSDGTLPIERLPAAARVAGLEAVAVTDHDRPHPALTDPVAERDGVTVVHGIELRVEPGGPDPPPDLDDPAALDPGAAPTAGGRERVDLLGYGLGRTDALDALVERVQAARVARGRAMVRAVEERLGVALDLDVGPGFGRPDLARAVAARPEADLAYRDVFAELIGDGGPAYVRRWVPSFGRGLAVLREACAVVGLAHPLRYADPAAALALTDDLDAVEVHYPYEGAVDRSPLERALARRDLLATGGSDAHDERLGVAGLDADEWAAVRAALE